MMVPSTGGVRVALHDLSPDGREDHRPPLLLVHATGFHGRVWGPMAAHLPELHAWAPDLRAHGDAEVPPDVELSWHEYANDVLAVVDALADAGISGDGGLLAAGHSMGGATLLLAEIARPGTFRSLYLFEPIVPPPMPELGAGAERPNPLAEGALRRRATFDSFDAAYENYAGKPPFSGIDPAALRAYVDFGFSQQADGTVRLKCRPEDESATFRMGMRHGAFERLGEVGCPVTVAVGRAEGEFGPAAFGPPVVEALPRGRLVTHPDLGHFGPMEAPAAIAADVRAALVDP